MLFFKRIAGHHIATAGLELVQKFPNLALDQRTVLVIELFFRHGDIIDKAYGEKQEIGQMGHALGRAIRNLPQEREHLADLGTG